MNGYSIEYLDSLLENIDKFVHNGHINDEKKDFFKNISTFALAFSI